MTRIVKGGAIPDLCYDCMNAIDCHIQDKYSMFVENVVKMPDNEFVRFGIVSCSNWQMVEDRN